MGHNVFDTVNDYNTSTSTTTNTDNRVGSQAVSTVPGSDVYSISVGQGASYLDQFSPAVQKTIQSILSVTNNAINSSNNALNTINAQNSVENAQSQQLQSNTIAGILTNHPFIPYLIVGGVGLAFLLLSFRGHK